jgi:SM-20-related protein
MASTSDNDPFLSRSFEVGAEKLKVFVFDRLFEEKALLGVYSKFRSLPYYLMDHDRDDTQAVKHLVHVFGSEEIEATPVIKALIQAAQELAESQGIKAKKVARVYANFNLHGDYQFAHEDGDVWTVLVFVNASWHEDWGGELLLYDGTFAAPTDRGFAYAISPRPGRMVIFDGRIKHRGGVPSKFCIEPRISFAVKFFK